MVDVIQYFLRYTAPHLIWACAVLVAILLIEERFKK